MSKESVIEELMQQRDAILFGSWRQGAPVEPEEACLVHRYNGQGNRDCYGYDTCLSKEAYDAVAVTAAEKYPDGATWEWQEFGSLEKVPERVNDDVIPTHEDAIAVLDETIKRLKDEL